MNRLVFISLIFILACSGFLSVKSTAAKDPVVYAVLFYSPTCVHCERLEKEFLPKLQAEYGKKLVIVHVNVISAAGSEIYEDALQRFKVPESRIRVPAMIIGQSFLVGTVEIPERLPALVNEALSLGGVDWPNLRGLHEQFFAQNQAGNLSIWQYMLFKFKQDPLANGISVLVLAVMLFSLIATMVITFSSVNAPRVLALLPLWTIPFLVAIGLGLAGYLSIVEVSEMYADCGPVGNCNAVQSSAYAKLFGLVPIAVLGMAGYVSILAVWLVQRFGSAPLKRKANLALYGLSVLSVLFSSYLTFLEPFIIGATCTFCLTSALVLTVILWISVVPAKRALRKVKLYSRAFLER